MILPLVALVISPLASPSRAAMILLDGLGFAT